jgi:hypothetical protein
MAVVGTSKNFSPDWDYLKQPFRLMHQSRRTFSALLDEWAIPYRGCRSKTIGLVYEVRRFHLFVYWRPMTVARFEDYTLDYRGPHLPIFASNKVYLDDEQYVHEGFDHAIKKNHRYRIVPWYFILPDFLLDRPWPSPRAWRWHPAVKVTASVGRQILELETEYGGWPRNRWGREQRARVTGCSGKSGELRPGQGWANFQYDAMLQHTQPEQQELFNE